MMTPEKDPATYSLLPHWIVFVLSILGGSVSYANKVRSGRETFSPWWFVAELFTAAFVGWVTYHLCAYAKLPFDITLVVVSISAHMGGEALKVMEDGIRSFFTRVMGRMGQ